MYVALALATLLRFMDAKICDISIPVQYQVKWAVAEFWLMFKLWFLVGHQLNLTWRKIYDELLAQQPFLERKNFEVRRVLLKAKTHLDLQLWPWKYELCIQLMSNVVKMHKKQPSLPVEQDRPTS